MLQYIHNVSHCLYDEVSFSFRKKVIGRHEPTFVHIRALTTRCQAVEFSCFPMWLKSRYVLSKGNFSLKNSGLCLFYCWWQSPNSIFGHSSSLWRFKAFKETSANAKMTLLAGNWSGLTSWGYRPSLTRVSDWSSTFSDSTDRCETAE